MILHSSSDTPERGGWGGRRVSPTANCRDSQKPMALTIELPSARRLAFGVVLGQAGVTLLAALVSLAVAGSGAAVSALLGGGVGTAASLAMAVVAFGRTGSRGAAQLLAAFFAGEIAKLAVMIGLFV